VSVWDELGREKKRQPNREKCREKRVKEPRMGKGAKKTFTEERGGEKTTKGKGRKGREEGGKKGIQCLGENPFSLDDKRFLTKKRG